MHNILQVKRQIFHGEPEVGDTRKCAGCMKYIKVEEKKLFRIFDDGQRG